MGIVSQVLRVYNMRGDFATPNPGLTRLPVPGAPLVAGFWGASDAAGVCVEGFGQVANFVVARAVPGRQGATHKVLLEGVHGEHPAKTAAAAGTSPGGRPLMAVMTRTKSVAVLLGDGTKVAEVEPNGIENYQVRT